MLNVVVGGARRRRRMREKKRFHFTCAAFFLSLVFLPRYTIPRRKKEENHTQPVCGEHKIKSISSLYHSRVSSMGKAHVFTMLRLIHQRALSVVNPLSGKICLVSDFRLLIDNRKKRKEKSLTKKSGGKSIKFFSSFPFLITSNQVSSEEEKFG